MTSKKYWGKIILDFVNKLRNEKIECNFKIYGYSFMALPGVFSPAYSSDTHWFAKKIIPQVKNLSFLEIGTGTGVLACLAILKGASKVVATDINPKAIQNTLLNQQLLGITFPVRKGNAFEPIKKNELFDMIFWNHPFGFTEEKMLVKDMLNTSVFDYKYNSLKQFLRFGKEHLTEQGKLLLGSSNVAKINYIKQIAKEEGYKLILMDKEEVPVYKNKKTKIDVRLYLLENNIISS
ncbi:MAG: methyltransferase [Bacteroidales bacterium]|nr:methyltransferase [Bacteroidales bacterium]